MTDSPRSDLQAGTGDPRIPAGPGGAPRSPSNNPLSNIERQILARAIRVESFGHSMLAVFKSDDERDAALSLLRRRLLEDASRVTGFLSAFRITQAGREAMR
jgi:hypothetical protein